jgi:hypothetical protein
MDDDYHESDENDKVDEPNELDNTYANKYNLKIARKKYN